MIGVNPDKNDTAWRCCLILVFFNKKEGAIKLFSLKSKSVIPDSVFDISDEDFSFIDRNLETLSGEGHIPINSTDNERCISLENLGVLEKRNSGAYTNRKNAKSLLFKNKA